MRRLARAAVAASSTWVDRAGIRQPAGEVHAWLPATNATVCGVPLSRAGLRRFPHVAWDYRSTDQVGPAQEVRHICRRCLGATGADRQPRRPWARQPRRP